MRKNTTVAVTSPAATSLIRYQGGKRVWQHFVLPPIASHPITGTFSYHLSSLPHAQWLFPVMGSFLAPRYTTTHRKDAKDAPRANAKTRSII
jgi:hypothetical protein